MAALPKRRGRPPLPPGAPRSNKKVRALRLTDSAYFVIQAMGTAWLEKVCEQAMPDVLNMSQADLEKLGQARLFTD